MKKNILKYYKIFIRSDELMKDKYVYGYFFNNENARKYVKDNYPEFHIVWIRID